MRISLKWILWGYPYCRKPTFWVCTSASIEEYWRSWSAFCSPGPKHVQPLQPQSQGLRWAGILVHRRICLTTRCLSPGTGCPAMGEQLRLVHPLVPTSKDPSMEYTHCWIMLNTSTDLWILDATRIEPQTHSWRLFQHHYVQHFSQVSRIRSVYKISEDLRVASLDGGIKESTLWSSKK